MNPIHEYLQSGESLLWEGQPDPKRYLRGGLAGSLIAGCAFTGFSLVMLVVMLTLALGGDGGGQRAEYVFSALFAVPFVLVGLYILVGRLFVAAPRVRDTWYGVTNQRVLMISGRKRALTERSLKGIETMQMDEQGEGFGTIAFGNAATMYSVPGVSGSPAHVGGHSRYSPLVPAFRSIPNVRAVYDTIKRAQAAQDEEGSYQGDDRRDESAWDTPPRWPGRGAV